MRRCIFCHEELSGNRSSEHVLPRWLERQLDTELVYYGHEIDGDTASGFSIVDSEKVTAVARTRVEGRVCASCNNDWLSHLETIAKPIISTLVSGTCDPLRLSRCDRDVASAWLYKTLLVAVSSGHGEFSIHPCDYHNFRLTGHAASWANIYIAVLSQDCDGFCGPIELKWRIQEDEAKLSEGDGMTEAGSWDVGIKWTFHIGQLHVAVCHSAVPDSTQVVFDGLHEPIWTPQPHFLHKSPSGSELTGDSLTRWIAFGLLPWLKVPSLDEWRSVEPRLPAASRRSEAVSQSETIRPADCS